MAKYLKLFETHAEYEEARQNLILPNVSYCKDNNEINYIPYTPHTPNNIITYTASEKLVETTSDKSNGLHTNKFSGATGALTITNHVFENGVGTVTFDDDVTSIGTYAFYTCSNLTGVDIPNTVTSIGESAFQGCVNLTSVTIPDSVTSINTSTFASCSGLTSVTIGNGVTSIGTSAFRGCSGLTSVVIPNSVTSIGNSAFTDCKSLTSVTIGSGVTSIGNGAFSTGANLLDNITCLATTAPNIQYNTFYVKSGGTLYVPIGSTGYNNRWQSNTPQYLLGYWGWTLVEQ